MSEGGYITGRSFNPASFGATIVVNGGILALLLGLASGVVLEGPTIIDIMRPTVTPPPVTETDPVKKRPVEQPSNAAPPTTPPAANRKAESDNDIRVASADLDLTPLIPPVGGEGSGEAIIEKPYEIPKPHIPVIIGARIDPRFKADFQPEYPPGMIRRELEGTVVVRVLIGTDGRVKAVEAVRADQQEFLSATRAHALKRWRFRPAMEDGAPIESWREMTVRFEIPKE